ncbi:MAG: class I SAM-dependent methyltransferase [Deltaproteobacteria bacterium]|jgi:SAM-dependent methyltransferase|nr:class I SAM-dependent methyltransferase [Deltaproteobacteria bacterium]
MMESVEELPEAYEELARLVPLSVRTLLDLGCGTGLELEKIFARLPSVSVTGIDITKAMLDKLREKFIDKDIELIWANYLGYDFGQAKFDVAVSFETMHHLTSEDKRGLYVNVLKALKPGGKYIECDYMVDTPIEQDHWFEESSRLRVAQGLPNGVLYHFDTPLTINNQIKLLLEAGFRKAQKKWRKNSTAIVVADTVGESQQSR